MKYNILYYEKGNIKHSNFFASTILVILFAFLFFMKCESEEEKYQKALIEYEKKVEQELSKNQSTNDIFMTFKFGDSKQTVQKKFRRLVKQKKIKVNSIGKLYYDMDFDLKLDNSRATFQTDYYNNKLYKFTLFLKGKSELAIPLGIFQSAYMLYESKYGLPQFFKKKGDNYCVKWIKNNREIEIITTFNGANITYTDKRVEKLIDAKKKNKKIEKIKKALKDI